MSLDLRKRVFIYIGLGVGLLLALIFAILFVTDYFSNRTPPPEDFANQPSDVLGPVDIGVPPVTDDVDAPTVIGQATVPANPSDRQILMFARDFVERYATYSNQNDNAHIEEVLPMVTDRMASWLESQKGENEEQYKGITTRVVASSFSTLEAKQAVVAIDVQEEIIYRVGSNIRYKSGTVNLIKQGDEWKIDGVFWE